LIDDSIIVHLSLQR